MMTVFTVHLQETVSDYNLILIKDGFSWLGASFGFIWALVVGAWELALVLLAVQVALSALLPLLFENSVVLSMAQLGAATVVGLLANEGRRMVLGRRGFVEIGTVTGQNKIDAERRFLDANPYIRAQLLESS